MRSLLPALNRVARSCFGTLIIVMKPARGSGRASTRGPRGTIERKTNIGSQKSKVIAASSPENRAVTKNKKQQSWKPLSKSSLLALKNMLDLSILSVLTVRSKEKEESQKHLNLLKNQFLAQCAQLSVPPRRYGDMMHVSHQFRAERQKSEQGKKTLEGLEENMRSIVGTLEGMEGKMDSLEEKCRTMRIRLKEEEENKQEFLQLTEQAALHLPALVPQSANEPSLQGHIMKIVPNPCAVVKALQTAPVVEDVRVFLKLAQKQVEAIQASNTDNL